MFGMLKDVARNQFDNLVVVDKKGSTVHLIPEVE
jgi:hypothetical protein